MVAVFDGVRVCVGVLVGVLLAVNVTRSGVGGVSVNVFVGVSVGVFDGVKVLVAVFDGVGSESAYLGVLLAVNVRVAVLEAGVNVFVGVRVGVLDGVRVRVAVLDGVSVNVFVGVRVGVLDGVNVRVCIGRGQRRRVARGRRAREGQRQVGRHSARLDGMLVGAIAVGILPALPDGAEGDSIVVVVR